MLSLIVLVSLTFQEGWKNPYHVRYTSMPITDLGVGMESENELMHNINYHLHKSLGIQSRQVQTMLKNKELKTREIEDKGIVLVPHRSLKQQLDDFFNSYRLSGTYFLERLACQNQAVALIFAEPPPNTFLTRFFSAATDNDEFRITIYTYYPASGILGFAYLPVRKSQLEDMEELVPIISEKVRDALKLSITGSDGLAFVDECNDQYAPSNKVPPPQTAIHTDPKSRIEYPVTKPTDTGGW